MRLVLAIGATNALSALNKDRAEKLDVRMALDLGQVIYGNIGAADRLDFTVIGAAVNETARIEGLCRPSTSVKPLSPSLAAYSETQGKIGVVLDVGSFYPQCR